MFQNLVRWQEAADEEPSDEADEGGFVPSPLDLSVRIGHGGADDEVVRELSRVEEQARELEDNQGDS
jgi:hypothetical protein